MASSIKEKIKENLVVPKFARKIKENLVVPKLKIMAKSINVLTSALKSGDVEYVRRVELDVLQNGKSADEYGDSALAQAAIHGSLSCCEEILKRCPSLFYKTNKGELTALHQAAINDRREVIKFLLSTSVTREECGDIESGITSHDTNNKKLLTMVTKDKQFTALHFAVEKSYFESAKLLIEADPSNNLLRMADNKGDTALHMAVKNNNLQIVKLLVQADPGFEYCPNAKGHTPVFIAFEEALTGDKTKVEIRRLLIEKQPCQCKVPIRTGTNNWTVLHHAAYKGDQSTIEDILNFCPAECLEFVDSDKQNFLHIAVKFKHTDVVANILELSTITDKILNGQDDQGNTPFHIAAMGKNQRMTERFLHNSRVSQSIKNTYGLRAIDMINKKMGALNDKVEDLNKRIKDQTNFDLLVGALIGTVSFTVGITVPGGYKSDGPNEGTPILAKKLSFKVFSITNTIALLLSLSAVFCHFCVKYLDKKDDIICGLGVARYCLFGAIFAMVVAFMTGSYVVLAVTEEFSIIVCVLCCCFFLFAFYALWKILRQKKPSLFSKCLEVRGICGCFSIASITSLFYVARD